MIRNNSHIPFTLLLIFVSMSLFVGVSWASYTKADKPIERISLEDARQMVKSGQALLVCSYTDDSCKPIMLEGALFRSEFEERLPSMPKDQRIIFYCG